MSDLKSRFNPIQRHLETPHLDNMGKGGALFNFAQKGIDRRLRALGLELDIAVGQVADPAGEAEPGGLEADEVAEAHALDPSADRCAYPFVVF